VERHSGVNLRKTDYESYDYREFWENNKRLYEDHSERIALRKLIAGLAGEDKIIFDIGCGYGRLFNEYKDFGTIVLVDYSLNNLKNARSRIIKFLKNSPEKLSSIYFIASDAANLPIKSGCADVVLTVRMIHHLENPEKYFSEVARILRNNGIYILEFANKRNFKNVIKFLTGRIKTSPFGMEPLKIGETILNFHPGYIFELLKERNFYRRKLISVSNLRVSLLKRFPGTKTLIFLERIYQSLFSFIPLGPSIFIKYVLGNPDYIKTSAERKGNLEDILVCASCGVDSLVLEGDKIKCRSCGRIYRIEDGIYNLRIDG